MQRETCSRMAEARGSAACNHSGFPSRFRLLGFFRNKSGINPTYTRQTDLSSRRLVLTPDLIRGKPNDNRRSP